MENIGGMEKGSPLLIDQADGKSEGQLWQFLPWMLRGLCGAWFVPSFTGWIALAASTHDPRQPAARAGRFDDQVCHTYFVHGRTCPSLLDHPRTTIGYRDDDCRAEPKEDPAAVTVPRGRPCHRGVPACQLESSMALRLKWLSLCQLRCGPTRGCPWLR